MNRVELKNLKNHYNESSFDYIIISEDINKYAEPISLIKSAYSLLKKKGQLFVSLKNVFNAGAIMNMLGFQADAAFEVKAYTENQFINLLNKAGISHIEEAVHQARQLDRDTSDFLKLLVESAGSQNIPAEQLLTRLMIERFWFKITK